MSTNYVILFTWAAVVSFVGSLQPGIININTFRIACQFGRGKAILFCLGATLAEILYAFVAVSFFKFIVVSSQLNMIINVLAIAVFLVLGFNLILKNKPLEPSTVVFNGKMAFLQSLSLSLLNPGLICFWLAATGIAKGLGYQLDNIFNILSFVLGAGIGALLLLLMVVAVSLRLKHRIGVLNLAVVNKITACIFFGLATIALIKLII